METSQYSWIKIGSVVSHDDYSCENFVVSHIDRIEGVVTTLGGKNGTWVNPFEMITKPVNLYDTGLDLVGKSVSFWNTHQTTKQSFNSVGKVIRYSKAKKDCKYLVEFPPTINQTVTFKMWITRNSLTQLN